MISSPFAPAQVEALGSLATILQGAKWALIGASAIRCRLALRRPTFDIDLAVGTAAVALEPRLLEGGWTRFLEHMRDDDGTNFARFVQAARLPGDDKEQRARSRISSFERGFLAGVAQRERVRRHGFASGDDLANRLHDAIDRRLVLRFRARGQLRIAEPHVLGTKNGRLQLLVWQTAGASSSGPLPNWRRFFLRDISALELTAETFPGARVTKGRRHSDFDRHIAVVSR